VQHLLLLLLLWVLEGRALVLHIQLAEHLQQLLCCIPGGHAACCHRLAHGGQQRHCLRVGPRLGCCHGHMHHLPHTPQHTAQGDGAQLRRQRLLLPLLLPLLLLLLLLLGKRGLLRCLSGLRCFLTLLSCCCLLLLLLGQ
jgi:hypothetical protein